MNEIFGEYVIKSQEAEKGRKQIKDYKKRINTIKSDIRGEYIKSNRIYLGKALAGLYKFIKTKEEEVEALEKEVIDYYEKEESHTSEGNNIPMEGK